MRLQVEQCHDVPQFERGDSHRGHNRSDCITGAGAGLGTVMAGAGGACGVTGGGMGALRDLGACLEGLTGPPPSFQRFDQHDFEL